MSNITITNNDTGGVILEGNADTDGTLQNADEEDAVTFAEGTILARNSSDLKFYPYDPAGSTGLNIPKAVLTYEVAAVAAETGVPVRVLTHGKVNANRLVIHGGTTITAAHLDLLRDYGIIPIDVKQLGRIDNPQA